MKTASLLARVGLASVAMTTVASASLVYNPIAFTGTDGPLGPGLGTGVTFTGFQPPRQGVSVNASGQAAFRGIINQGGGSQGAWLHNGTSNANVALAGGAIPGGGTFGTGSVGVFAAATVNASGNIALRTSSASGVIASVSGTPTRVAMAGDAAPGTAGTGTAATFSGAQGGSPLFNNAGQIAVFAGLNASPASDPPTTTTGATANASGLWIGQPGALSLVLRQNDTVASIDPAGNARIGALSGNTMAMNGSGKYLISASLQGSGVVTGTGATSNSVALVSNRNGFTEKVARVGDAAPTTSGTEFYRGFSTLTTGFNNAGRVAFQGSLRDGAGTQTSTASIFTDAGTGVMREVARAGAALPTLNGALGSEFSGVTWGTPSNSPLLSGNDVLAFTTSLTGAATGTTNLLVTMQNVAGVDTYTRIARSGDAIAPNVLINSFNPVGATGMNFAGQICFQSSLTGSGVTTGVNDQAMLGWDPTAGLITIIRTGDTLPTPLGSKIVASFGLLNPTSTGGEDGRVSSIASNGNVAFSVVFTDLTEGVYMTRIPTPGAVSLMGLAALCAARRRR
jgi:hypothetical protein